MKILCPTDFSDASTHACISAANLLTTFDKKAIHLCHCINIVDRADVIMKMEDKLRQKANEDLKKLQESIELIDPKIQITNSVALENPKTHITKLAEKDHFDLIFVGTEGVSALKDMTVGSVTKFIIQKSSVPVLAIPPQSNLNSVSSVAIGVESDATINKAPVDLLKSIAKNKGSKLIGISVRPKGSMKFSFNMETLFPDLNTDFQFIESDDTISNTIANYVSNNQIDLLVMIHQKKNWLQRIFYNSITKAELFRIDFPLLVLPG